MERVYLVLPCERIPHELMGLSRLSCLSRLVPADARHTWFSLVAVLQEQGLWSDDIARELRYAASWCCVEEKC